MRFALTPDQLEFRAQLRALLADRCRPADVRAAWEEPRGWSDARWAALAELGVTGLTVPAAAGGLGLGPVDLVVLLEELGRAAAPEPVAETVGLAVPVLAALAAGGDKEAAVALEAVAAGALVATVAVPPVAVGAVPPVAVGAEPPDAAGSAGRVPLSLAPAGADLVVACTGTAVVLLPAGTGAVVGQASLDGTWRPGWVTVARGGSAAVGPDGAAALLRATVDRGALAVAATLVGLADRMLDMAVGYAGERYQFGQPVGSFQAVKHLLADVAVRLEHTRPAVLRAAWSLEQDQPTAGRDVSMAKAMASDLGLQASRAALQVHGAIGYTWEHDLHLWMKRAWCLAPAWGDAAWHRARLLAAVSAEVVGRELHPPG